jgi:MazG family protein
MNETPGSSFERLVEIMRRLRAPDGCPWDREQTPASLRPFVLEETYEVLEAIEHGTPEDLCEELGDFVFEAVFLARMHEEAGHFSIGDVVDGIADKLVRRHPHVFERGDGQDALTSGQVVERWEALKARERALAGKKAPEKKVKTTLSGVPKTLPSLLRAYELSSRAAAVGFDWAKATDVLRPAVLHRQSVAEARGGTGSGAAPRQRQIQRTLRARGGGARGPRRVAAGRVARRDGSGMAESETRRLRAQGSGPKLELLSRSGV